MGSEPDRPFPFANDTGDGSQGRGLADAIAAENADRLAFCRMHVDAVKDVALVVPGIEVAYFQVGRPAHGSSPI
jgi:hypothetical protein